MPSTPRSAPSLAALASADVATDNNNPKEAPTEYPDDDYDDGVVQLINTVHEIGSGPLNRPGLLWHLAWLLALCASAFIGGLLSYRFLEQPLLRASRRAINGYFRK